MEGPVLTTCQHSTNMPRGRLSTPPLLDAGVERLPPQPPWAGKLSIPAPRPEPRTSPHKRVSPRQPFRHPVLVAFHLPPASTRSARFNHMPLAALLRLSRGLCNSVGTMSSFYAEVLGQNGSYKFFLDNEWRESASGKQLAILNPSTNAPVYSVQGRSRPGPPPRRNSFVGQPGRLQAPDPRSRGALRLDGIGRVQNRAGRRRAPGGGGGRGGCAPRLALSTRLFN